MFRTAREIGGEKTNADKSEEAANVGSACSLVKGVGGANLKLGASSISSKVKEVAGTVESFCSMLVASSVSMVMTLTSDSAPSPSPLWPLPRRRVVKRAGERSGVFDLCRVLTTDDMVDGSIVSSSVCFCECAVVGLAQTGSREPARVDLARE